MAEIKSASSLNPGDKPPLRPNFGQKGQKIKLRANFYGVDIPKKDIHHYDVTILPGSCPPRVNREVMKSLVDKRLHDIFNKQRPVFDGKKNLYSISRLSIDDKKYDFDVIIKEQNDDRERKFKISLKWAAQVNMYQLEEALKGKAAMPLSAIQALDVVLRQIPSMRCIPVGRSFFSPPSLGVGKQHDLGEGRELWFGHHQSIRPSQWKMLVNIDVSATAFYKSQPAIDFLKDVVKVDLKNGQRPLNDIQRLRFVKEVKGLKVEITHMDNQRRKYRVINVTKLPASKLKFPFEKNGKMEDVTVEWYFSHKYNKRLMFPNLPCLQVGQEARHTYLPIEVCNIVAGQRCIKKLSEQQTANMIRATAKEAPAREGEINKLAAQAKFGEDIYLKTFGVKVNPRMVELEGRVLPPPSIGYNEKGLSSVTPREGKWDMRGKKFVQGVKIDCWAMVVTASQSYCKPEQLQAFCKQLEIISTNMGMPVVNKPSFCKYISHVSKVKDVFREITNLPQRVQLVIVVLDGKTTYYAEIKKMGDKIFGVRTQCIQLKNVKKADNQTLGNVCLKINAKLGGINSMIMKVNKPKVFGRPVIFLGADVTHPSPGDDKSPSIAAVVGSLDPIPNLYQASVRVQKGRMEIISDLKAMTRELLLAFYRKNNRKPENVIMYRDGVSEGQFQQVLQYEMHAIQQACLSLETSYNPNITFVVVQKRHHARFFAQNKSDQVGKSGNIPAGTTVDTVVCHPSEFDFYLCSHAGIQGTSRPAHYHMLYDDNNFSSDEFQQLSFYLCHTYVRCTRSVSIPAPAYYAHLVAFRARHHLMDYSNDSGSQASGSSGDSGPSPARMAEAVKLSEEMQRSMYFA